MKQLTILSHNVFWFQGVPFATDQPPAPNKEVLKRLCAIYQEADADVICLQEIQSQEAFEAVSQQLGMQGCYCPGLALPQYGGALFWRGERGRALQNSHSCAVESQRMWQTAEMTGGHAGIKIGNVHLPSSRQLGEEGAAVQRVAEIEALLSSFEGGLDIIAGDFNEQPGGSVGRCLARHGYVDTAVLLNRADAPANLAGGRGDYVWVKREMSERVRMYDIVNKQDFSCNIPDKSYLSDHLPLWITMEDL